MGTITTSAAVGAARQFKAPVTAPKVNALGSFDLNIGEEPIQIKVSEDLTINIFPRKGKDDLLFVCEHKSKQTKKLTLTIQPKAGTSKSADTDSRGQAEIKGNFKGNYVLVVQERKV